MNSELPSRGRLIFRSGASNLTIVSSTSLDTLYEAEFRGINPEVTVRGGEVSINYPQFSPLGWMRQMFNPRHLLAHITLNASIPWEIECHGGLAHFTGELGSVHLRSFRLDGGASVITLRLGQPEGHVPVQFFGGMTSVNIERPASVPTNLRMRGGTTGLRFDDQSFGAMGGQIAMHSHGEVAAPGQYDIEVTGGAANINVTPVG
ncbi:MAG TPA: hypothetical protein VF807_10855 [Ktedonobacterales bacterium]